MTSLGQLKSNGIKIVHIRADIDFVLRFPIESEFIMASRKGKTYCFYLAISALFDTSNICSC